MAIKIEPSFNVITAKLENIIKTDARELVERTTLKTYFIAKRKAARHNVTGLMERNISYKLAPAKLEGEVFVKNTGMLKKWRGKRVNYAVFVHFGTRPHVIEPRRKKALRFIIGNKFVFAKKVQHTGYEGDPFLFDALKIAAKKLKRS